MARSNYTPPRYINEARALVASTDTSSGELALTLDKMTARHDSLLQQLYRLVDNYEALLAAFGPYHEVELGEPLSRIEQIYRKAHNEDESS